jgi:hypothetical protein
VAVPPGRDNVSMSPLRLDPDPVAVAASARRAWWRYLADTRDAEPEDYDEVEEQAWQRLVERLDALGVAIERPDRPRDRR